MTAPRAKRRTTPFRTLEELGAEMLQFHGGMGDPIYAAGSYYHSGKRHPSRAVEIAADRELTKLYDSPDPTWTKKDMAGLWRAIITMARLLEFDPSTGGAKRQRTGRDKPQKRLSQLEMSDIFTLIQGTPNRISPITEQRAKNLVRRGLAEFQNGKLVATDEARAAMRRAGF